MKTSKQRTRVVYAPLVATCSLHTSGAATQVYNAELVQYEPDRALSPMQIIPEVMAVASDGTVGTYDTDGLLQAVNYNNVAGNVKWTVNGTDITTLTDWVSGKDYRIYLKEDSAAGITADKIGTIVIYRNIPQGQQVELRYEAEIPDTGRTGGRIRVISEPIILTCADKADDQYVLSLNRGTSIAYDPGLDRLALYDYEVAAGLAVEDASLRRQATDDNSYLRDVPVSLYCGKTCVAPSGYTLKIYKQDAAGAWAEITPGQCEVVSLAADNIRLDLRLVEAAEYRVDAYTVAQPTVRRATVQFSAVRLYPDYQVELTNTTSINPNDTERRSQAVVRRHGQVVQYPERLLDIQWLSDTSVYTAIEHNAGPSGYIRLDKAGFTALAAQGWMDLYIDFGHKGVHAMAMEDAAARVQYTDKAGNPYIFTTKV